MADVTPFRGIKYNIEKLKSDGGDIADVVAPPYDVISPEEQREYHKRHSYNIIRLILGLKQETDNANDNPHTRAAAFFQNWLDQGILIQDKQPALYATSLEFYVEGKTIERFGVIAQLRIEPFESKVVLPHERTFSRVKSERFELMKKTNANFSPIFSLYPDGNSIRDTLKSAVIGTEPDIDFTDDKGHRHRMWTISDPSIHDYLFDAMKEKRIYIADGHHRYETALEYRKWIAEKTAGFSTNHPANYIMMSLYSMDDPGLIILPAHRMLTQVPQQKLAAFIPETKKYFDIMTLPIKNGYDRAKAEFISTFRKNIVENTFGIFIKDRPEFYILTLKPGVMNRIFGNELEDALKTIDVTVLTRLIFMEILGFDQSRLDNEKLISYSSITSDAVDAVARGLCDIAFILNPTRIDQVQRVAGQGLIMPRKSTYFYPKVITGKIIRGMS